MAKNGIYLHMRRGVRSLRINPSTDVKELHVRKIFCYLLFIYSKWDHHLPYEHYTVLKKTYHKLRQK